MNPEKSNEGKELHEQLPPKDDALFDALGKSKKKKKRKILRTVLCVILVLAILLTAGVSILQRQVREQFASSAAEVLTYEVQTGTISTVVSGSGTLTNVDTETLSIPSGVTVSEILVELGDTVVEGEILATVDTASVRTAMADLQSQIEDLDEQIGDAEGDQVSSYIKAGVTGRVKVIHAQVDQDVSAAMVEHGALAVLSLDGYMALKLETDNLNPGDSVTVLRADGSALEGSVESVTGGTAVILVTDDGPEYAETVTVGLDDGTELGTGELYIHSPLAVTGYAGTISYVNVKENQKVYSSTSLFRLTNTASSVNYDALLRQRSQVEDDLLELLAIQRSGGITAPISGSIVSAGDAQSSDLTQVATICPDISMSVTISVDESDILSLELGQEAEVTVSSVSEDAFTGTVTQIDTSTSSYTALITLDKISGMLPGMTASVDVRIEGVDNALIIPVDALHQTSDSAYVYTSYDQETQQYGGKVDVTVGIANSNYVEITSGLSEGDTVYYTESQSFADMFSGMGFGGGRLDMSGDMSNMGGNMPDMGGSMPDKGGNMPDMGGDRSQNGGNMPGGG